MSKYSCDVCKDEGICSWCDTNKVLALRERVRELAISHDRIQAMTAKKKATKLAEKMKARSPSARGRANRLKGKAYERVIANDLKPIFGKQVARSHGQSREKGEAPDVKGAPMLWPECKHHGLVNVRAALQQAYDERLTPAAPSDAKNKWPVAFCKDDRRKEFVAMYKDDFLVLLKQWWNRDRPPAQEELEPFYTSPADREPADSVISLTGGDGSDQAEEPGDASRDTSTEGGKAGSGFGS